MTNITQPILDWCDVTAEIIWGIIVDYPDDSDDANYLIGTYLNEVKEIVGLRYFSIWLASNEKFGLTDYKRLKLMRKAKEQNNET